MNESQASQNPGLTNIAGVQFHRSGRIYSFDVGDSGVIIGDKVVVDTERGQSLAEVRTLRFASPPAGQDLRKIIRVASERDLDSGERMTEAASLEVARDRVRRLGLEMQVLKAESQFGGNKVIVYFSAPGRIDFRDLVKDLAGAFKARVELKQVGARDETKLLGGLGVCGREYCCSSFLREFVPVSIKMAKMQNLALNPTKVSGGCGRLLCCLTYENSLYQDLRRQLPELGAKARHKDSGLEGMVVRTDILNQKVSIEGPDGNWLTCLAAEVEVLERPSRSRGGGGGSGSRRRKDSPSPVGGDTSASRSDGKDISESPPADGSTEWGEDLDLDELSDLS